MRAFTLILIAFYILLFTFYVYAQSITWQRTYHPFFMEGDEVGYDLCPAESSNFYIVGVTAPTFRKMYVLKLNKFGDTIWTRVYGYGEPYAAAETNDNGCIFAGYGGQAFACRIKPNGDTLWLKLYNTINFFDIKKTLDSNYILCGANYSVGSYNGYVCKIDPLGNVIWERVYPTAGNLDFIRIELALDSGYIVGGQKDNGISRTAYIAKINDTGILQWEKNYPVTGFSIVSGIAQKNNGYVFTGWTNDRVYLLKTDKNGDTLLTTVFQNTNNIYNGPALLRANNNKFYVAHINDPLSRVFSVDSNFNVLRQISLQHSPQVIYLYSIINAPQSTYGDIICSGLFAEGDDDTYVVRLDSSLNQPPPISVEIIPSDVPGKFTLYQNYPNPFNPTTKIKFAVPPSLQGEGLGVRVFIYDILGREIALLVNAPLAPGTYEVEWPASNYPSGIYFYKLVSGDFSESRKMILLK